MRMVPPTVVMLAVLFVFGCVSGKGVRHRSAAESVSTLSASSSPPRITFDFDRLIFNGMPVRRTSTEWRSTFRNWGFSISTNGTRCTAWHADLGIEAVFHGDRVLSMHFTQPAAVQFYHGDVRIRLTHNTLINDVVSAFGKPEFIRRRSEVPWVGYQMTSGYISFSFFGEHDIIGEACFVPNGLEDVEVRID